MAAKTISFRGKEKGDFVYYVAKTLACNNFKVAIIDNSYSKDLFESVHQYADRDNYREKENMLYLRDVEVDDEFNEKFDYVIYYFGFNDEAIPCDLSFVMCDYTMVCIHQVAALGDEAVEGAYLIMRDKVSNKIPEKSVLIMLGMDVEHLLGYIPLSERDEAAYVNFNYNGRQRIKDLSPDMQYSVMTAVAMATDTDVATVKKYYAKAKRNKRI